MAKDTRHRTTWGHRLRFLTRFAGLTGALAAAVGGVLAWTAFPDPASWTLETAKAALRGDHGDFARGASIALVAGLGAAALAFLVEVFGALFLVTGRRTAAGTTATLGTAAAIVLLVCVNVYSFRHPARFDLTRDKQFTLPPSVADELRTLRPESPTTIVVVQQHRTFGTLSDKADAYDTAAEQKVAEKVLDLVERFREFGPRFNVAVLDLKDLEYERRLDALTKDAPELKAAITAAPENSIFFHANKRVQRLAFNEFLQLDRTASKSANDSRGNLVLVPQGVESFARRVFAVQEKRPKVAVCVIHELLSTSDSRERDEYTLAGMKRSLVAHGFDVTDIVMKKDLDRTENGNPAVYTKAESEIERLEAELEVADLRAAVANADAEDIGKRLGETKAVPDRAWRDRVAFYNGVQREAIGRGWAEVVLAVRKWIAAEREVNADNDKLFLADIAAGLKAQEGLAREAIAEAEKEKRAAQGRVDAALADERPALNRRTTNLRAKFAELLADVDLLFVPRLTIVNPTTGFAIPPEIHTLSKDQAAVIADFMKSGRPILACLGPVTTEQGFQPAAIDDFEKLLAARGVELGKQAVLFDAEAKAFTGGRSRAQFGGAAVELPPVVIGDAADTNPIGRAVRLSVRAADALPDLKLHAPRPVALAEGWKAKVPFAAEFVTTAPEAWSENVPLPVPVAGRIKFPRFDRTSDPNDKNPPDAERRGPFPIGVALESRLPAALFDERFTAEQAVAGLISPMDGVYAAALTAAAERHPRPASRLVVFGSGGLFTGVTLKPAQEKLLLHSANWLVNRADRLPRADKPAWSFPRVAMTDRDATLWRLGTAVGMPLLAIYLGLVAVMLRKMR